ncbi:MAG: hypothetical protein PHP50_05780 [Lachnospiraceae bacterium]|nr:hypothetical protein [Lachnospiraceae bacterium]
MGLLYDIRRWLDHVTEYPNRRKVIDNGDGTQTIEKAQGRIIQQGTARNAPNYNNMETGIFANSAYVAFVQQQVLQLQRNDEELQGEIGTVELANSRNYPFPGAAATVSINNLRSSLNYEVHTEVMECSGGFVEEIEVYDKQLNGFKIRLKGSAKSAVVKYSISGGLYQ